MQALISSLRGEHDTNEKDHKGDAPIHAIVKQKRGKRLDLLFTLLTHSNANINLLGPDDNTALHFAAMVNRFCV